MRKMLQQRLVSVKIPCLAVCGILLAATSALAAAPHYVFAHYMVCFATYGETVEGYKREIQEAQAAGIDGFALNVGAWSGPDTYYKKRVGLIYDAAESLQSGFKLFFSAEITNTTDIVDMVKSYAARTNSFRQGDRVVLSTFGQNSLSWSNDVFAPLKAAGVSVFFVPHFWPSPVQELPGYSDAQRILQKYGSLLDGLFLYGAAGLPSQLAQCNSNYTKAVHQAGKIFMASVTPHYWGCAQPSIGRRYFEFGGGEGLVQQWDSIVLNQPDWVEIVTWNDFNESSYICPVDAPEQYSAQLQTPRRYSHKGYLELSKRYVNWYKTGQTLAIDQDALFFSYRTHSKGAVATDTNDIPVSWFAGDVQDAIYTTVLLTAPAQLEISSGAKTTTNSIGSGLNHLRTPFNSGQQKFSLKRDGTEVLSATGPDVLSVIQSRDFFPATGFACGNSNKLKPPGNLQLEPQPFGQ